MYPAPGAPRAARGTGGGLPAPPCFPVHVGTLMSCSARCCFASAAERRRASSDSWTPGLAFAGAALLRLLDPLLVEDPLEALGEEGLAERILALVLVGSLGRRVEAFEEAQSLDLRHFYISPLRRLVHVASQQRGEAAADL